MSSTAQHGRSERDTATGRLLRAYEKDGDTRARDRLVALYLPLVETFAHRYGRPGAEYDDLVQAGSIGLLNAIERYDPRRGEEFAAFAVPTVVGEMKRHIRDRAGAIKLPRRLQEARARLPAAREQLTARLGREPRDDELAAELGLDPVELERLREPLHEPLLDGDEIAPDLSDERVMLAGAFRALDESERSIVYLRYVRDLDDAEVAKQLGMSERQLARQTRAALSKLRGEIERGGAAAAIRQRAVARDAEDASPRARQRAAASDTEDPPAPARQRETAHSGRLLLRMPQSLHAELARAAEREEISLNQFITNSLAAAVGWRRPGAEPPQPPSEEQQAAPPRWLRTAMLANIVVVAVAAVVAVVLLIVAWQNGW